MATLSKRGITKDERDRVRNLVETAKGLAPEVKADPFAAARLAEMVALRAWYDDWSETARSVITRRDHLIRLCLAKRKKAAKRAPTTEGGDGVTIDYVYGPS